MKDNKPLAEILTAMDSDDLAAQIKDWRGVEPHSEYKKKLEEKHFRKYAFWEKYR